jgi:hypothetical protein
MPSQLFVFIQLEFPWALGPSDGRYLLRAGPEAEPERVLVLGTLSDGSSPARREPRGKALLNRLAARGLLEPAPPEPPPVTRTRVTVIDPIPLSAEAQARAWLADLDTEHDVLAAAEVLNHTLQMHRIAAADAYVHEVSPAQALVIRAGWGEGEQVADGRWLHAQQLTWSPGGRRAARGRRGRASVLRPQERLAALLGGRSNALACEELTLRARLDLDHDRARLAVLELDQALTLAVTELRAEQRQDLLIRIAELEQLAPAIAVQAGQARGGAGAELDEEAVEHALGRLEASLRARTASGVSLK